jgi:hypothetical protein
MPVDARNSPGIEYESSKTAWFEEAGLRRGRLLDGRDSVCSSNEFHAPQALHLPIHLGLVYPHSEQTNSVFGGFCGIVTSFLFSGGSFFGGAAPVPPLKELFEKSSLKILKNF